MDARTGDVLDENFTPELKLCGCPQVGEGVIVFGSGDPPEVASENLRLQFEDEL